MVDVQKAGNGQRNAIFTHNQVGPVRLLFPTLFEPKPVVIQGKAQGDPIYSAVLLVPQDRAQPFLDAIKAVAEAKFGKDLGHVSLPVKKGSDEKQRAEQKGRDGSFYEGNYTIKATSKFQPGVVDQKLNAVMEASKVWSGVWAYTEVNFATYDAVGTNPPGVKAYLNRVLTLKEGDRIAGRTAQDAFGDIAGQSSDESVVGGQQSANEGLPI